MKKKLHLKKKHILKSYYQLFDDNNLDRTFFIQNKSEFDNLQKIIDTIFEKESFPHRGINLNDYRSGKFSLPFFIWFNFNGNPCLVSHQCVFNKEEQEEYEIKFIDNFGNYWSRETFVSKINDPQYISYFKNKKKVKDSSI